MSDFPTLKALSPLDGRYRKKTAALAACFSEEAIIQYRILVEVKYLKALLELPLPGFTMPAPEVWSAFETGSFSKQAAGRVKEIEQTTNHDVKAVEYFLREQASAAGMDNILSLIHFGLTSQDINNTAFPMAVRDAWQEILRPVIKAVIQCLIEYSEKWADIPMLARTHGQPASPTFLGKEIYVFAERLQNQLDRLETLPFSGKFGGATGNFNAHHIAFPEIDWPAFADGFLEKDLGLQRQQTTTQIEHYDDQAAFFDGLSRINTILIDLDRDIWTYISMDYFKQKIRSGEVGSSAMPHKVNPIDFENSEGNLGIANALFAHLSAKLPISRLQRDLTDSTVIRNIGVPFGHSLLAWKSLLNGLDKLIIHEEAIRADLAKHPEVLAEAIQSILRREGVEDAYEQLKELTRTHEKIDAQKLAHFAEGLPVGESVKELIRSLKAENYTGLHPWKKYLPDARQ